MIDCPECHAPVAESARLCSACGRGIAVIKLRATIHGEPRVFTWRMNCDPDDVDELDGTEADLDNPEELPGREN